MNFKQYKKVFDVSSLKMNKTSDSAFKNDFRMLSVVQLNRYIDSLSRVKDSFQRRLKKEVGNLVQFQAPSDLAVVDKKKGKDTYAHSFADRLPDSVRMVVMDGAINLANSLRNSYQFTAVDIQNKSAEIRWSEIEWHRKFSLSLSCLVLFFIGAPLGSIIRRGGMGLPLVVALACFVLFHLLNIFGEKFSREGLTSIFFGMWLSVFVLVPVGFFFTYKAMHDSQLFNKEYYLRLYKKVRSFLRLSHK
jgi:lipopolysaccharide export system permease protein